MDCDDRYPPLSPLTTEAHESPQTTLPMDWGSMPYILGAIEYLDRECVSGLEGDAFIDQQARIASIEGRLAAAWYNAMTEGEMSAWALVRHQESQGVAGGASGATTHNVVTINTEVYDPEAVVTVASPYFFLIPGIYRLCWWSTVYQVGLHQSRIVDLTNPPAVYYGSSETTPAAAAVTGRSVGQARFQIDQASQFRLYHYTQLAKATNGLGLPVNVYPLEVYAEVEIFYQPLP